MALHDKLRRAWLSSGSSLCVGLDPDPVLMPACVGRGPDAAERFCIAIIDATADLVCAFKPQIAYFAAQRAERQLERICGYLRDAHPGVVVILDAKRADIGPTAAQYAAELFDRYGVDAATVNPFMGTDSVEPILRRGGAFVLCRTSNPGADDIQSLDVAGRPLYTHVAELVATRWSQIGECGLVVGATRPDELRTVRAIAPELPFLVPGIGAQGGDVGRAASAGRRDDGTGLVVSSSRSILYASSGDDFAAAARAAALATRDVIAAA